MTLTLTDNTTASNECTTNPLAYFMLMYTRKYGNYTHSLLFRNIRMLFHFPHIYLRRMTTDVKVNILYPHKYFKRSEEMRINLMSWYVAAFSIFFLNPRPIYIYIYIYICVCICKYVTWTSFLWYQSAKPSAGMMLTTNLDVFDTTGLILGLHPAYERRRYKVTLSIIGRV